MWLQNSWWTTARVVFQTKTYKLLSTCTEYTVNKMLGRLLFIPNFLCKACSFSTLFFSASLGYWHYKLIKKYPLCCRVSLTTAEYFLIYFSRWINARSCCTIVVQNQHPKSKAIGVAMWPENMNTYFVQSTFYFSTLTLRYFLQNPFVLTCPYFLFVG